MKYFDSTATVFPDAETAEYYHEAMLKYPYNPAALYESASDTAKAGEEALRKLAGLFDCEPSEIIVCSGATEASNTVIKGRAFLAESKRKLFISSKAEHAASYESLEFLRRMNYEVQYVPLKDGACDVEAILEIAEQRQAECALITMIAVNNETGKVSNMRQLIAGIKKRAPQAAVHFDAVQMPGKLDFSFRKAGCDYMTLAGHKLGAPKGIGFLLKAEKSPRLEPLIHGGGQQDARRSGTENVPLLMTSAFAIERYLQRAEVARRKIAELRKLFFDLADAKKIVYQMPPGIEALDFKYFAEEENQASAATAPDAEQVPHIISIVLPQLRSETLLNVMSAQDICLSAGSACSAKRAKKQGRVLKAAGLSDDLSMHVLRISLSEEVEPEDIKELVEKLAEALETYKTF